MVFGQDFFFVNWHSGELSKNAKIWLLKINRFFLIFFHIRPFRNWWYGIQLVGKVLFSFLKFLIPTRGNQFRGPFFVKGVFWLLQTIFELLYFLKRCPIFDDSPLYQFTKYNNFLLGYWFLAKNLSNFESFENLTAHITFRQHLSFGL